MKREIKIERGIPIPAKCPSNGNRIYPFDKMKIKDSFFVKLKSLESKEYLQDKLIRLAYYYTKRCKNNRKFTTRQLNKGVRVWRVK